MATLRLDQRRVDVLKPRKSAYDVRDRELRGFGVRVLPSGAGRYFIHSQHNGRRFWKIVGQAGDIGLDEARSRARTLLAAIRNGSGDETTAPPDIAFETVVEEVFHRYARNWKPSTLKWLEPGQQVRVMVAQGVRGPHPRARCQSLICPNTVTDCRTKLHAASPLSHAGLHKGPSVACSCSMGTALLGRHARDPFPAVNILCRFRQSSCQVRNP